MAASSSSSSSSSSSPQTDTCLNFITHLLKALKDSMVNVFFHDEKPEQLSQPLSPEIASSSRLKHQVFLSFRGEDTRPNFTAHLLKALKDTGMNVFFDEEKLEKGEQLSQALSLAIAASNLSIIVLSVDYASSKSCLAELSDIMRRKDTQGHIALPIFTMLILPMCGIMVVVSKHPSITMNQIGYLKYNDGKLPLLKPETEYIKDIVEYVIKKLMSGKLKSASAELVGIDDQKQTILTLIEQEDSRLIGLWGQGGIGKTTLSISIEKVCRVCPRKSRKEWESEVDKLKEYERPKISQILRSSFDDLDELEKNIFLDIAIFFKGTLRKDVEKILSCCYKGVVSGISNLIHKCLLDSTPDIEWIFMHDMLEEMGKDIVRKESINPEKRSRLWGAKDVFQVLRYNKCLAEKFLADQVDSVSLPEELKYLRWDYYPFKSLSGFNPKNLVVLKLIRGDIEYLWNDDDHQVYSFILSSFKIVSKFKNSL
ncbi:disease resistance protein RUN1 [Gossypium hirsutum]|uniref:Disease resistance protein RUN1 n=1 Tax=Gossypium hirsutum TaxID=3635 RepID=A0ABM3AT71_GOSHI|nr:disease resistance protein RUN1-like [Gossypium hirsutum]